MLVLACDTSTFVQSLALCRDREVLCRRTSRSETGHGGTIVTAIASMLEEAGIGISAVEGFACGLGPGSFTGLRIGLATMKGFAYATGRPIAGASSLKALAMNGLGSTGNALLCPVLDARKGEVYAAVFGADLSEVISETVSPPETFASRCALLGKPLLMLGDGWDLYRRIFSDALGSLAVAAPAELSIPDATHVAALCLERLEAGGESVFTLEPHYVRASEAELKRKAPQAPQPSKI